MDTTIRLLVEINESQWTCFQHDLGELTEEEINWRPLPQANNINAILRHLLVESRWHLKALKTGEPMPAETNDGPALEINTAPLDFGKNRKELEDNYSSFIAILRETTPQGLKQRTHQAFKHFPTQSPRPDHQLGFHRRSTSQATSAKSGPSEISTQKRKANRRDFRGQSDVFGVASRSLMSPNSGASREFRREDWYSCRSFAAQRR